MSSMLLHPRTFLLSPYPPIDWLAGISVWQQVRGFPAEDPFLPSCFACVVESWLQRKIKETYDLSASHPTAAWVFFALCRPLSQMTSSAAKDRAIRTLLGVEDMRACCTSL